MTVFHPCNLCLFFLKIIFSELGKDDYSKNLTIGTDERVVIMHLSSCAGPSQVPHR